MGNLIGGLECLSLLVEVQLTLTGSIWLSKCTLSVAMTKF